MKPHEQILFDNKDFITVTALHNSCPDRSSSTAKQILEAYNEIDPTVSALVECATCKNPFETAFRIIYAYCEDKNWFEKETYILPKELGEALGLKEVKSNGKE